MADGSWTGSPSAVRMLPGIIAALESTGPRIPRHGRRRLAPRHGCRESARAGRRLRFRRQAFQFANVVAGEAGVLHAARLLTDEVFRTLGMMGYNTIAELAHARADGAMLPV